MKVCLKDYPDILVAIEGILAEGKTAEVHLEKGGTQIAVIETTTRRKLKGAFTV